MGIQINGNTNNINAGIGSLSIEDLNELDIVGVATAANFKTGVSNLHDVGLTLSGGQIDVGSNIKIGNAGVITATSFSGSGASLTNLNASNIASGTVPTARLGSGTANSSTFLAGDSTFKAVTVPGGGTGLDFNDNVYLTWGGGDFRFFHSGTHNYIRGNGSASLYIQNSASEEAIRCTSGGSVKIGYGGNFKLETTQTGAITTGIHTATGILETTGSELKITGAEPRLTFTDTDNNPDFQLWANAQRFSIYDSTNSATRIRIDSSGNIGMNTTTASDSTGNCRAYTFTRTDNNGQVRIILKNGATGFGNGAGYHQGIDGVNAFIENRSEGGYLDLTTKHGGTVSTKLRIKSDGYFAIGNTHGAKKIHISTSGNQKILIDPNYNNNSGGSSNSEANANSVVDSVLIRTSYGSNAASQTNAGHKWGIKFQGYNGNDFTQNISKVAAVYAVSEDEATGYNKNVGLAFHTSPYNTNHREAMRINTNGYVTKPYHPAFCATRNGANQVQLSSMQNTDIVFTTVEFDNSGSYNNSNGRFTAPIAGKYYFGVQFYVGFSVTGVRVMHAKWRKNGSNSHDADLFGGISNHGGTHYHPTSVAHVMMNLAKDDYVTFNTGGLSTNGSGNTYLYGTTGTRFFGYLVG